MTDDEYKIKATDYLTESLKTLVTICAIFIGGLIAFQSGKAVTNKSFYWAVGLFSASAFVSVLNINSIINKVYRSNYLAIQTTETKLLSFFSLLLFVTGVALSAVYMSNDNSELKITRVGAKLVMDKHELMIGKDFIGVINFNDDGNVVTIDAKAANKRK
ncbi:hypothetical protein [Alloalcanivorax gelatiniphagus]|uniref:Uncharacterized protein n=1 Tax=Alloalcanivorax gelatiniphagus TaxID=1194167 RepID=A0ABY2XPN1_9GAMM|nr:hypothetical protein [Alloalcanivorax gelatiniphagus]TMW14585.1 hypothetical protein FGS76_01985 [Alloalcanivorax gelatiniphagus]